jgi:hypothetical protein
MKIAHLVHLDGRIEYKQFVGVPRPRLFSYQKGEHGNIVGRMYFQLDEGQDVRSNSVTYTEVDPRSAQTVS